MRIDLPTAQRTALLQQIKQATVDRGPLTVLYSPPSTVHRLVHRIRLLADAHRQEQSDNGCQRREGGLSHGLRQRDLRPGQNGERVDQLQDLLHVLHGRRVHKTEDHTLDGLVPKRNDHQMTNADLPFQGSRDGIIKYPGHSRDIHHNLHKCSH